MKTLVLNDVDDALLREIAELATANRVSIEEQATCLLKQVVNRQPRSDRTAILASIAAMTPKNVKQTDSVNLLREDRDR